ncbi:hypothetical protein CLOP_g5578 [Closterium sp. NIES-67]|nr:hypothetical protein CLOP_g5578 [Closterium sp. NIES-67]
MSISALLPPAPCFRKLFPRPGGQLHGLACHGSRCSRGGEGWGVQSAGGGGRGWESGCAAAAAALSAGKAAEAAVTGSGSGSGAKPGISSLSFWVTAAVVLICGCVMAVPFLDSLSSSLLRLS